MLRGAIVANHKNFGEWLGRAGYEIPATQPDDHALVTPQRAKRTKRAGLPRATGTPTQDTHAQEAVTPPLQFLHAQEADDNELELDTETKQCIAELETP